jgi:hypothetical protein
MPKRSAATEIRETTLASLPGLWNKILYLARLRRGSDYEHWGIQRTFGREGKTALAQAHQSTFTEILRTPASGLAADAAAGGAEERLGAQRDLSPMLPAECSPAGRSHFRYLITAVRELLKANSTDRRSE